MLLFVISIFIGVLVGVLSGMLGIGGGMIMVPIFRLGYLMEAIEATATSLFVILPTSLAGCITHLRNKTCLPLLGLAAGLGGACTSWVGVRLANNSPSWMVMLVAAVIIIYSAFTMLKKARALPKCGGDCLQEGQEGQGNHGSRGIHECQRALEARKVRETQQSRENYEARGRQAFQETDSGLSSGVEEAHPSSALATFSAKFFLLGFGTGLLAGLMSGYVGVGGGFIMVPLFISLIGVDMKKASGTSLIAVSILAIPGVISQMLLGNVFVWTGIAMAIGSIPGAVFGAALVKRVPERQLSYLFSGLLALAAVLLLAKEVGF